LFEVDLRAHLIRRHVDGQPQGVVEGVLVGRIDDVFLGVLIEIALVEGRWIEGVEELLDLADAELDGGDRFRRACAERLRHDTLPLPVAPPTVLKRRGAPGIVVLTSRLPRRLRLPAGRRGAPTSCQISSKFTESSSPITSPLTRTSQFSLT